MVERGEMRYGIGDVEVVQDRNESDFWKRMAGDGIRINVYHGAKNFGGAEQALRELRGDGLDFYVLLSKSQSSQIEPLREEGGVK